MSTTGSSFIVKNKSWFTGKKAGEYLELGFQMSCPGDVNPTISEIKLNGQESCEAGGSPSLS